MFFTTFGQKLYKMRSSLTKYVLSSGILTLLAIVIFSTSACNSAKQVAYFQNVPDTTGVEMKVKNTPYEEPLIHSGDVLSIEVTTIDATIEGITTANQGKPGEEGNQEIKGYAVDKNGYVEIPIFGRLKVDGLTTSEAKEVIRKSALKYYKDPMVNVRIANYVVSVLGAVKRPGRYILATEKVNILDAIALAGDLDITGKRYNVMVIREENGESTFTRVNLNSTDIFQSEYFYIQSGDKIYVEPLKTVARSGTRDQTGDRYLSLFLSLVSVSIAIYSIFSR